MLDTVMPLQGWVSNHSEFNDNFQIEESRLQNMLGVQWNIDDDTFSVVLSRKLPIDLNSWIPTKRNFLSALVSIFDPLGLLGPIVVHGKLFVQSLWKLKVTWNRILSSKDVDHVRKLLTELRNVNLLSFPRFVIKRFSSLHVFTDASSKAYGAVAYVVGDQSSNTLVSKQSIAPCNKHALTIPKLELVAVLIGSCLAKHLHLLFPFDQVYIWNDSKVTLSWIFSDKELKDIYVSNRVYESYKIERFLSFAVLSCSY